MKIEFKRNLPHIYLEDAVYDINFRLVDTIPKNIFLKYADLKKSLDDRKQTFDKLDLYNEHIDKFLNEDTHSKKWLANLKIQEIVRSAIMFNNNKLYKIIALCIMPNHVHLILSTHKYPPKPLGEILKSIKQFSATQSNKLLHRNGQFWHHESFDHIIRSRNELAERIKYLVNNPVAANLVSNWNEWPGNYVDSRYIDFE